MVDVSDTVLKAAKKKLAELTKGWGGGVCQGAVLNLDGSTLCAAHTACHAWVTTAFRTACKIGSTFDFTYESYPEDAKDFMVLTCHKKKKSAASKEAMDAIILWMARESPFAKYVLNADDTDSLTNDGAIILCGPNGASLSEAMWMCKVLRYSTEGSRALDTWKVLYDGGVNPMLAVLVCTHIASVNGATFGYSQVCSHVRVFNCSESADPDILNLLRGESNPGSKDTSSLFNHGKNKNAGKKVGSVVTKVRGFCKPFKKSDGWGGFIEGNRADATELVERVLKWQRELEETFELSQAAPAMPDSNTVYLELDL
jgi:hypothetical protein